MRGGKVTGIISFAIEEDNLMKRQAFIEAFSQSNGRIRKAAERAEAGSHICERSVKDILDEVGDCLHDDRSFRRKMLHEIFTRPAMKRTIASKFISLIIQQ
ncbi:MAG: hypothetical protein V3T23_05760 [Nitrososphaerales archaeon]